MLCPKHGDSMKRRELSALKNGLRDWIEGRSLQIEESTRHDEALCRFE
jgi:hypothetical protein